MYVFIKATIWFWPLLLSSKIRIKIFLCRARAHAEPFEIEQSFQKNARTKHNFMIILGVLCHETFRSILFSFAGTAFVNNELNFLNSTCSLSWFLSFEKNKTKSQLRKRCYGGNRNCDHIVGLWIISILRYIWCVLCVFDIQMCLLI